MHSEPSKEALFDWANALLRTKANKLSQFSSGVYLCQLFDIAFPRRLNLAKVVMRPTNQFEFQTNVKLLLEEARKADPRKVLNMNKIVKDPYEDVVVILTWLKQTVELRQSKQQHRSQPRESILPGIDQNFSETFGMQSRKVIRVRAPESEIARPLKQSKKSDCPETYPMPFRITQDEFKVKQIQEILEKERNLKASSKLERIRRIIFGAEKQLTSVMKNGTEPHQRQENMPSLINSRIIPESLKSQFKTAFRIPERGRQSLLLSVPLPDDFEPQPPRKSMNLLECDPEDK